MDDRSFHLHIDRQCNDTLYFNLSADALLDTVSNGNASFDEMMVNVIVPPRPELIWDGSSFVATSGMDSYAWLLNGEYLEGVEVSNYSPEFVPGIYQVEKYNEFGCKARSEGVELFALFYVSKEHGAIGGEASQLVAKEQDGTSVEAIPDVGYHFASWSDGLLTPERTEVSVTAGMTVTATFSVNVYTISALPNNADYGQVEGAGEYEHGQQVALTATPATGYHFVHWTEGDDVVSEDATYEFEATANRDLTAHFLLSTFAATFIIENEHCVAISDAVITLDQTENPPGDYIFANLEPGKYSYLVKAGQHFEAPGEVEVIDQDIFLTVVMKVDDTSIVEPKVSELKVYPNPVSGILHLEFTNYSNQAVHIFIISVHGQQIKSKLVTDKGAQHQQFDMQGLIPGVYLITLEHEDGVILEKIIVQ